MESLRRGSRDRDRRGGGESATQEEESSSSMRPTSAGGHPDEAHVDGTTDYLPGARHPLHVSAPGGGGTAPSRRSSVPRNRLREVAIMELSSSGVVVFPGDSLPLRVRGPWERYLSSEIERQRLHPSLRDDEVVQFGVITAMNSEGGAADGTTRRRSFGSLSRQSWTRQAWGPRRLSRYSYRLAQELQRLADSASSSSSDNDEEGGGAEPARRNRLRNVGSGDSESDGAQIDNNDDNDDQPTGGTAEDGESDASSPTNPQIEPDAIPAPAIRSALRHSFPPVSLPTAVGRPSPPSFLPEATVRRRFAPPDDYAVARSRRRRGGGGIDRDVLNDDHDIDVMGEGGADNGDSVLYSRPDGDEAYFVRMFFRTTGDVDAMGRASLDTFREDSPIADPRSRRRDPTRHSDADDRTSMVGRIGTMVTVLYTHGDDVSHPGDRPLGSSNVWRQHGQELIITARGTGRFRVVRAVPSAEPGPGAAVRRYLVEDLTEEEMSGPSLGGPPISAGLDTIHLLARTTPIPEFVWRHNWPDHLATQIRQMLNQSPSHRSLVRSMSDEQRGPLRLSYWLSSNMALQQHEKVALLEMMSPAARLRWILRRLKEAEQSETVIQCKRCGCPITRGSHAFSIGGAQGTTGNYVNEYGHVHQTVTFHSVDEDEVSYTGDAETRDSWFPGYSWTIMNCGFCQSHLGWKFRLVDDSTPATEDRPTSFYGLSTGQVASIVPEVSRVRRRGSLRH